MSAQPSEHDPSNAIARVLASGARVAVIGAPGAAETAAKAAIRTLGGQPVGLPARPSIVVVFPAASPAERDQATRAGAVLVPAKTLATLAAAAGPKESVPAWRATLPAARAAAAAASGGAAAGGATPRPGAPGPGAPAGPGARAPLANQPPPSLGPGLAARKEGGYSTARARRAKDTNDLRAEHQKQALDEAAQALAKFVKEQGG